MVLALRTGRINWHTQDDAYKSAFPPLPNCVALTSAIDAFHYRTRKVFNAEMDYAMIALVETITDDEYYQFRGELEKINFDYFASPESMKVVAKALSEAYDNLARRGQREKEALERLIGDIDEMSMNVEGGPITRRAWEEKKVVDDLVSGMAKMDVEEELDI